MFFKTTRKRETLLLFQTVKGVRFFIMQAKEHYTNQRIRDWTDVFFSTNTGYVAIARFEDGAIKEQTFHGRRDIKRVKDMTAGQEDMYISINSFKGWHEVGVPTREAHNLKQIRNIAIDIDQYDLGLPKEEAIKEIQRMMNSDMIPRPNLLTHSNGIQMFYNIENGASPNDKIAWWATYITEQFVSKLKHVGADPQVKDLSRIMRVPNSINSRNNSIVEPFIWKTTPYTLQELYGYCKPFEEVYSRRKKRHNKKLPYGTKLINNVNYARLVDLERYIQVMGGDLTGKRNTFIYVYAFHQSLIESDFQSLMYKMQNVERRIGSRSKEKFTQKELETTVRKAYDDAKTFFEYLVNNDFKITNKPKDGIRKPYTSENLVKLLDIEDLPDNEQMTFKTIVSNRIRKLKDRKRKETHRRSQGIRPMQEYQQERQQRKQTKKQIAIELRKQGKTQKEIANKIGVSQGYVSRILRNITDVSD